MQKLFEWDIAKARSNIRKHGVRFDEAQTVFTDDFSITIPDPDHSAVEERFVVVGQSHKNRLVVVVYTERGKGIRLISARQATRAERKIYEKENFG
jgi:uncharacterized DUF497 family protein